MEAKELRIENLVNFEFHKDSGGTKAINVLASDLINILHFEKSKFYKPIPLTEEWLVKFGFIKKDNSSYWHPNKCWHRYVFGYNKFGLPYLNLEPEGGIIPHATCNYVHQLQNLYFALTNKELTIK